MTKKALFTFLLFTAVLSVKAQDEVYELRTYELTFFKPADVLHNYIEKALIPALNRQGIKNVGSFEEADASLPKKIYLLIPHQNIAAFQAAGDALLKDKQYLEDAKDYLNASPETMPYKRININLIRSTAGYPKLTKREGVTVFELRIYDSYNEDALRRKVKMFNDSEFKIFKEAGLPMIFFGSNIAGNQLPCLTYMLGFKDMDEHRATWAKFGEHPEWKRIVNLEEYKNAMNEITRVFLKPLPYSQL